MGRFQVNNTFGCHLGCHLVSNKLPNDENDSFNLISQFIDHERAI